MGVQKLKRVLLAPGESDLGDRVTSTAQVISNVGTSVLGITGSTADKVVLLARPGGLGIGTRKFLLCRSTGVQKLTVTVAGTTTTGFFEGTTFRSIVFSSKSTQQRSACLVAASSATWSVVAKSTGTSLAG